MTPNQEDAEFGDVGRTSRVPHGGWVAIGVLIGAVFWSALAWLMFV
jgi:hypothetical protein